MFGLSTGATAKAVGISMGVVVEELGVLEIKKRTSSQFSAHFLASLLLMLLKFHVFPCDSYIKLYKYEH